MSTSNSLDEIDQIMNEIEELQQSMGSAQPVSAAPPPPAATKSTPVAAPPVATAPTEIPQHQAIAQASADDVMAEFQAGKSEDSIEETLGTLKDDEPLSPGLIDTALEGPVVATGQDAVDQALSDVPEAASPHAEQEDTIEEFDEPIQEPISMHDTVQRRATAATSGGSDASVSVKLSGEMTLKLSYEYEGQEVTIGFTDGALRVELSDGTEFKIPVRRNSLRKAA